MKMDIEHRRLLERGLESIVVTPCDDKGMVTVVWIAEVDLKATKKMAKEAIEIMREQIRQYDNEEGGPAFEMIGQGNWHVLIDFNENDDQGDAGHISGPQ